MDEKEKNETRKEELTGGEPFHADLGQTEENLETPSPGELEAQEKMENIFKSVSQNRQEPEPATQPGPAPEDEVEAEPESNQAEIELMTVRKPTSQQKRAMERKRQAAKKRKNKRLALKLFFAALIVAVVVAGGYFYADYMPGGQNGEVVVTIPEGAGTAQIAKILNKNGLVNSKGFYRLMSKVRGVDGKYNFGKFKLNKNAGYEDIFKALTQSGVNVDAVKITIPEGYEIYKIADTLAEKGLIDKDKFFYLVDYGDFDYDFVKDIPERDNRLEGYLFPSTYEFTAGDEYGIINEMLAQFDKVYEKYKGRAKEMNMTMDEAVTLASIIEREALGDEDRKLVSSVFHNRMDSSNYPYLQSCATVQYVLKERKPVLSVEDTKIDSPYNTYINKGLPIGPIASPGEKSIEAALYPEETDYLFFVLGSDNKHHFSKTYEEHMQNKNG